MKKILVPIDLGNPEIGLRAVEKARQLATLEDASLHIVTVMPGFGMPVVSSFFTEAQTKDAVHEFGRAFRAFLKDNGLEQLEHSMQVGKAWEGIVETASKVNADLIVIHHHARYRPGGGTLIGSCSQQVAERAPCSVYVIKE